jgi:hypothetical protein
MTTPENESPAGELDAAELADAIANADEAELDQFAASIDAPEYPEGDVEAKRAYLLEVVAEEPGEAPPPPDEPSSNAILADLERENTRHRKAFAKALGVEVEELHDCPTCEGVGFTPEPVEPEPGLQRDPFTETCERCAGYGSVKTGARPPGLTEIPCPGCGGQGYVQKVEQPDAGQFRPNGQTSTFESVPLTAPAPGDTLTIAEARARGYTILDPIEVPAPSPT